MPEAPAAETPKSVLDDIQAQVSALNNSNQPAADKLDPNAPEPEPAKPKPAPAKPAKEPPKPAVAKSATPDPNALPDPDGDEPPAKPADKPADDDDDSVPPGLSEKGKIDWKKQREEKRAEKAARIEFESKYKAATEELERFKKTANPDELKKAVEERDKTIQEMRTHLQAAALERDPQFNAYFNGQRDTLLERAKEAGGEKIAGILAMPPSPFRTAQLKEAAVELDDFSRSTVANIAIHLDNLHTQKQAELAKAGERWNQMTTQQQQAREQKTKELNQLLDSTLDRWASKVSFLKLKAPEEEGAAEHNAIVEAVKARAKNIYNGNLPEGETAKAAGWAAIAPEILKASIAKDARIRELEEKVASLTSASPDLNGNGDGLNGEHGDEGDPKESFGDAVERRMRKAGLGR